MNARVLIAAGGTGGHIYPALALAHKIREKLNFNIAFIGTRRGLEKEIIPAHGYPLNYINIIGLSGSIFSKFKFIALLFISTLQSLGILLKYKPNVVIGAGGYVSFPVILASFILRIKTVLMEQNVLPGKATRFLAMMSNKVLVSFSETKKYLKGQNIEVTGNPVREDFFKADRASSRKKMNMSDDKFTLLVFGASQGAANINKAVLDGLKLWKEYSWQILHLTGKNHIMEVKDKSSMALEGGAKIDYRPLPYTEDIVYAYAASDLVICRAGATTVAEIMAIDVPSILVPYPHHADRHQWLNAKFLEDAGGALLMEDEQLGKLPEKVIELYNDKPLLEKMRRSLNNLPKVDAADKILEVICSLCKT